jgi:hypothetical protein
MPFILIILSVSLGFTPFLDVVPLEVILEVYDADI